MKKYKILFADLDGTLIKTKSRETFPKGIWDMEFRFEVLDAIKKIQPLAIFIVSNQGGIEKGFVDECHFQYKKEYIAYSISEYTGVSITSCRYCSSNDEGHKYRKPNTGMLDDLFRDVWRRLLRSEHLTEEDCLMIGDASGKEGQFSDTDKKTAENFGCDYMDVEDFVKFVNEKL